MSLFSVTGFKSHCLKTKYIFGHISQEENVLKLTGFDKIHVVMQYV